MPDPIFAEPRLAALYDDVDDDRGDLDAYAAIVQELNASSVLDIGCGTGTFACRLAHSGVDVVAVDPAGASLDVARRKDGATGVRWLCGDASDLPPLAVDLAVMTGNVAQVFLTDAEWEQVLNSLHGAVRRAGWLVFESRDPARRAWEAWTRGQTYRELHVPTVGRVDTWIELVEVHEPFVSFRHTFHFHADSALITSDSTLRFRDRDEITGTLQRAGFTVREVRSAPDRPGLEFVFLAQAL
jgi:SAM-dependent methyltransferase